MGLLALVPFKDWVYCGAIIAILAGGFYYHHKLISEGIEEQRAADDKASAMLIANTTRQTAELQARAMMAEQAYDKEHADNQNYRDSHPIEPVRLCLSTTNSHIIVSKGGAANSGNASAGTAAANVPSMPGGDRSSGSGAAGPDISEMLFLLAGRADQLNAELREFQSR